MTISTLCVEVTAVAFEEDDDGQHVIACNDQLERASAFAVYIRNPMAFHVQDFLCIVGDQEKAMADAFFFADNLAEHLSCDVVSQIEREGRENA